MADATVDDVRAELETSLDDEDIVPILERASRDVGRQYDADDFADDHHRGDLEAVLTAYRIASGKDRRAEKKSLGSLASKTFETSEVDHLRSRVRQLDPGSAFTGGTVKRNTDRTTRAVEPGSEMDDA